jgi:hypothetical protein
LRQNPVWFERPLKVHFVALLALCPSTLLTIGSSVRLWHDSALWTGGAGLLCPGNSDINLFRYGKSIIDLDA